jgi:hypothetical protein
MKNGCYKKASVAYNFMQNSWEPYATSNQTQFLRSHPEEPASSQPYTRTAAGLCKMVIGYQLIEISSTSLKEPGLQ